jgi:murein DD-endopeptidase MepM/ murein hydrolase activator NlpD
VTAVQYIWPVRNKLPSFPWGRYPSGGYHPAYDFAVPTGTAVYAPASGTVIHAGWDDTGYGIAVFIRHATGHISILAHNETLLVKVGQTVRQGQQVSWSDSTGRSSGPHVHWETRTGPGLQRYTAYDPRPYVGAGANYTGAEGNVPTSPSSPSSPGGPTVPSPAWYGTTPGVVIPPAAETITGEAGAVQPRFSPAIVATS